MRKRRMFAGVSRILFPGFQLLLLEKERRALGEAERLLEAGLGAGRDGAGPPWSGWGLDAAGRIGRGLERGQFRGRGEQMGRSR